MPRIGTILHDEVDHLPERLRAPLVLCYLEGLTYGAAAHQLGLSDGTLRGRLAQARKRLRAPVDVARCQHPRCAADGGCIQSAPLASPCFSGPFHHPHRAGIDVG